MQQIIDFVLEIDTLKGVTRKTRPLGRDRPENSAEHSWQIALLATTMAPYAAEPVNIDHVVAMLLVHDIGEIDTGDTIGYAVGGWEERKAAELAGERDHVRTRGRTGRAADLRRLSGALGTPRAAAGRRAAAGLVRDRCAGALARAVTADYIAVPPAAAPRP